MHVVVGCMLVNMPRGRRFNSSYYSIMVTQITVQWGDSTAFKMMMPLASLQWEAACSDHLFPGQATTHWSNQVYELGVLVLFVVSSHFHFLFKVLIFMMIWCVGVTQWCCIGDSARWPSTPHVQSASPVPNGQSKIYNLPKQWCPLLSRVFKLCSIIHGGQIIGKCPSSSGNDWTNRRQMASKYRKHNCCNVHSTCLKYTKRPIQHIWNFVFLPTISFHTS